MTDEIQAKQKRIKKNSKEVQKRSEEKRKNNPERIEYCKWLQKQPHIVKNSSIGRWKRRGVITNNFDSLYDNYLSATNCDLCDIKFDNSLKKTSKCLDHDHETGLFRNFLCNTCNMSIQTRIRKLHRIPLVITDNHYNCACGSIVLKSGKKNHESTKIHLAHLP